MIELRDLFTKIKNNEFFKRIFNQFRLIENMSHKKELMIEDFKIDKIHK
jgi:hypothetical protein